MIGMELFGTKQDVYLGARGYSLEVAVLFAFLLEGNGCVAPIFKLFACMLDDDN